MGSDAATWIGIGIGVATAIFGFLGWLLGYVNSVRRGLDDELRETRRTLWSEIRKVSDEQNLYRHNNIDRTSGVMADLEERMTRRIERLENSRHGMARQPRDGGDGNA